MFIGVLGPLEVRGEPARLSPRDRVVVEAMAVRHGDVVSLSALAEALWAAEPPTSATKILQGAVVRLRRELGRETVSWTGTGYRLTVPVDELDVAAFERRLAHGRRLIEAHELARAVVALDDGLALWRGPPFPDIQDWTPAVDEIARLTELRSSAWEDRLDAALACGRVAEVIPEAQRLVVEDPFRERGWHVLAGALYGAGRQSEALDVLRRASRVLREELGLESSPMLADLERSVLRQDLALPRLGVSQPSLVCPYPGLSAFQANDADHFTGRDEDIAACLAKLEVSPLLAIVGPSGCGKSSLARAGLVPRLRAGGRPVVIVTPGSDPLGALAAVITEAPRDAVLVVDQFEEVAAVGEAEVAGAFHDELVTWTRNAAVVLTVRADRLADVTGSSALTELVERGLHLLAPLAGERLRTVVHEPARRTGLVLEAGLTDLLLRDVEGQPGALPLLSHALRATWQVRDGNVLTVEGYVQTGRIEGAVAKTADRVFHSLTAPQRTMLRGLLLRLVTRPTDGAPVAARLPAAVVDRLPGMAGVIERLVAARLVTRDASGVAVAHESLALAWPRLRTWLEEDVEGRHILSHLQVAVDGWIETGRPDTELYRGARLQAALEWRDRATPVLSGDEEDFLATSSAREEDEQQRRLAALEEQRRQNRRLRVSLGTVAVLLVAALTVGGLAAVAQAAAERAERAASARELAAAAGAVRPTDPELALLLAIEAVGRTRDTDGTVLPEALDALYAGIAGATVINTYTGVGGSVDMSPDGSLFVTEGPENSGLIDVRDVATGRSLREWHGHDIDINEVVFAQDGTLVTAGDDGSLAAWDPRTGRLLHRVALPVSEDEPNNVWSPSMDADGRLMAAAWQGSGDALVTDVATGERAFAYRPPADTHLRTVALSPDGATVATVLFPPAIILHDIATGEETDRLDGFVDFANVVKWSPDGQWIAATGDDHARVWRADDGELVAVARGHRSPASALDWSADSRRFITVGDGLVKIWELDEVGVRLVATRASNGTRAGLSGGAISPDGLTVLAGDFAVTTVTMFDIERDETAASLAIPSSGGGIDVTADGEIAALNDGPGPAVTLWDPATGEETRTLGPTDVRPPDDPYWWLDVSPDGRTMALATPVTVTLWDLASDSLVTAAHSTGGWLQALTWSHDGEHLAVGADDTVVLDRSGGVVATLPTGSGWQVTALAFSPDGDDLAVARSPVDAPATNVRYADVWDWTRGERRTRIELDAPAFALSVPGDGTLITGNGLGEIDVRDIRTGRLLRSTGAHTGGVFAMSMAPGGETLATGGNDGVVRLWDLGADGAPVRLTGSTSEATSVAVTPDGAHLVAAFPADGFARVWSLDVDDVLQRARDALTRDITEEECRQYLHNETC